MTVCILTLGAAVRRNNSRNENAFFLERPRRGSWRARTREGASVAAMASAASREMAPTASSGSVDVNGTMRGEYRGRRCPRWRMRDATSGRPRPERGAGVPARRGARRRCWWTRTGRALREDTRDRRRDRRVDARLQRRELRGEGGDGRRDVPRLHRRADPARSRRGARRVRAFVQSFAVAVERASNVKIETNASASGAHDAHDAHGERRRERRSQASSGCTTSQLRPFPGELPIKIVRARGLTHTRAPTRRVSSSAWTRDTQVGPAPKKAWYVCGATADVVASPTPPAGVAGRPRSPIDPASPVARRRREQTLRTGRAEAFERRARSGVYEAEDEANFRNSRRKTRAARSRSFFSGRNDIWSFWRFSVSVAQRVTSIERRKFMLIESSRDTWPLTKYPYGIGIKILVQRRVHRGVDNHITPPQTPRACAYTSRVKRAA